MSDSARRWKADRGSLFYRGFGLLGLLAALVGFFTTYSRPLWEGRYDGPWWGHVHGALALSWLLLFIAQSFLVPARSPVHRKLGWAALAILPAWAVSTVLIWREVAGRMVARGDAEMAAMSTPGAVTTTLMVLGLVGTALALRRRPAAHKRLMLVATVLILWPAWSRWRHYFPDPPAVELLLSAWVAMAPIPLAMLRDWWRFGAVHPALLWGGGFALVEQVAEINAFGTAPWTALGRVLLGWLL